MGCLSNFSAREAHRKKTLAANIRVLSLRLFVVCFNANYIRYMIEEVTESEITDTYLEKLTKNVEHEIEKKFCQQKTPINFTDLILELHSSSEELNTCELDLRN